MIILITHKRTSGRCLMSQSHIVTKSHLQAVFSSALNRIRNKSGSKITEICLVNYVRPEIVQTVLKIGPYR